MARLGKTKGFTLIELMLVVAIIGLLGSIALPKFGNLILKSKEAAAKGHLGSLRSALSIYYCDNEGWALKKNTGMMYLPLLVLKYMDQIPKFSIPRFHEVPGDLCFGSVNDAAANFVYSVAATGYPTYTGRPRYFAPSDGTIAINCTHSDSNSRVWSTW